MTAATQASTGSLTVGEARRIALAAQGFGHRRTTRQSSWRRAEATIGQIGLLQMDSVSVLVRAHYVPVYSRIGAYDRTGLDQRAFAPDGRAFFEYWAHEASLLPLKLHPLMRWRMDRAKSFVGIGSGLAKFAQNESAFIRDTYLTVASRGEISAAMIAGVEKRTGSWWGWNRSKAALEYLFWTGEISVAGRRGFERFYDITERTIPDKILSLATPDADDAIRGLVHIAARALGIATETDIRDYFRLPVAETRREITALVEQGLLHRVDVDAWHQHAYLAADAVCPNRIAPSALISPFDPLVWHRPRSERIFGFHYRIEIYVPAAKRRHGYYVLPFLDNGRFRARVDLKADRMAGKLIVKAAHLEPGCPAERTACSLANELDRMAEWLGLDHIQVDQRGDLASELARHVRS